MTTRVNVLVRVDLDDLIFMDVEGFEALVEEAVGGEGCISAWTAEVETVENNTSLVVRGNNTSLVTRENSTSLVIRVQGDWDDWDEDVCDVPECTNRLDDGEGFDGYCGTHADIFEQEGRWST